MTERAKINSNMGDESFMEISLPGLLDCPRFVSVATIKYPYKKHPTERVFLVYHSRSQPIRVGSQGNKNVKLFV